MERDSNKRKATQNEALVVLNRDFNAAVEFLVSRGEVDALTPEAIPALRHLRSETLMELQIDALLARLARYENWKETKIDGEKYGFHTSGTKGQKSYLDQLADELVSETVEQIENLAKKRLELIQK